MHLRTLAALCFVLPPLARLPFAGWKRIEAPLVTTFPRDHGAHFSQRTEWWYATGIVQAKPSARRYGWQLTVFRQGLDPSERQPDEPLLAPRHLMAGHLVIIDLSTSELVHAERLRRIVPALADASETDLDVRLDGWSLRRADDGTIRAVATDRDARIGVDLSLRPSKPLVMHGQDGISLKGAEPGNASAYASWTRLATSGTLTVREERFDVEGEAWFDHEWGTSQLGPGVVGWDWFGLRLDDGRELMLYRLRRADGSPIPQSSGTLVERDGTARHLALSEIELVSQATWKSARTQAVYPARWRLRVPTASIDVEIAAEAPDCEVDARASTGNMYWEGPVRVQGSVGGSGYGELTGYAGSMEARF